MSPHFLTPMWSNNPTGSLPCKLRWWLGVGWLLAQGVHNEWSRLAENSALVSNLMHGAQETIDLIAEETGQRPLSSRRRRAPTDRPPD